jgi:hypothetical protein
MHNPWALLNSPKLCGVWFNRCCRPHRGDPTVADLAGQTVLVSLGFCSSCAVEFLGRCCHKSWDAAQAWHVGEGYVTSRSFVSGIWFSSTCWIGWLAVGESHSLRQFRSPPSPWLRVRRPWLWRGGNPPRSACLPHRAPARRAKHRTWQWTGPTALGVEQTFARLKSVSGDCACATKNGRCPQCVGAVLISNFR